MAHVASTLPASVRNGAELGLRGRDLLSLRDLTSDDLLALIERARLMKTGPLGFATALRGRTLGMIFEKPSLRTRVTFDVGMYQLGGHAVYLSPAEISLGKRESISDVAKNLERMVQAVMIRTFAHETVVRLAEAASIPVINGLSDFSHPCQGLADFMTMREVRGDLRGLKLAWVGDGNNVLNSLIFGGALLGARLSIATPPGFEPPADVVEWAVQRGRQTGSTIRVTHDPREAVDAADVVYTDTWISMGQEAEAAERRAIFGPFQVNEALFARASSDAIFMHCLPAHRGEEVTDRVIDSPRSVVFDQAENRLHVQKAVLVALMG
jgi:ornithine carbamoyltransferase